MVDTDTRLMAVLGSPVRQSYSAVMHNRAFSELGLNCLYMPIECGTDALADIITGLRRMNFIGFNLTKPLKVEVIKHLDELDTSARMIGAVNTVKKDGGRLIGYNTDGAGFLDSLRDDMGFSAEGKVFFIIGAGGAARAVAAEFLLNNAGGVLLSSRTFAKTEALAAHLNSYRPGFAKAVGFNESGIKSAIAACDFIINASGVGMYPDVERTPLDKSWLKSSIPVCDLTYNPDTTRLLADAREIGAPVLNGLGMLINQGARAFELWLDTPAPIAAMREACMEALV